MRRYPYKTGRFSVYQGGRGTPGSPHLAGEIVPSQGLSVPFRIGF